MCLNGDNELTAKRARLLFVFVVTFAASLANAAPTVSPCRAVVNAGPRPGKATATIDVGGDLAQMHQSALSHLAREFLRPPAAAARPGSTAQSLPAVPGALLMVVTGFVCVSLVRDRRFWLAAAAGMLGLGHAGLSAVPEVVSRLRVKRQIHEPCRADVPASDDMGNIRARADLEGTQYIGLLHHLAGIPVGPGRVSPPASPVSKRTEPSVTVSVYKCAPAQDQAGSEAPQQAVIHLLSSQDPTSTCSAYSAGRLVCFFTAFALHYLARGPPQPA
ncbi:MAG: hypothetical protein JSU94_00160 [Phycisphaerales bacterium]|nr:MAG: hypothetical protein JSU94_00160 [Phycisphaerales bacterium]